MQELNIEPKNYFKISEQFYTTKAALNIELTGNGMFLELAPFLATNDKGNNTYSWDKKITNKYTVAEMSNFYIAIDNYCNAVFAGKPPDFISEQFKTFCLLLRPKYNKADLIMVHDPKTYNKSEAMRKSGFRLNVFDKSTALIYEADGVVEGKGVKYSISIPATELAKFRRFMDFIINKSFII